MDENTILQLKVIAECRMTDIATVQDVIPKARAANEAAYSRYSEINRLLLAAEQAVITGQPQSIAFIKV